MQNTHCGCAWGVHLVKCLTFDFCSGHDLRVLESSPSLGSARSLESAWDSLFPSLCPLPPPPPPGLFSLSLSLSEINFKNIKKEKRNFKLVTTSCHFSTSRRTLMDRFLLFNTNKKQAHIIFKLEKLSQQESCFPFILHI